MIKSELKDWQIAQIMFGSTTKLACKIVKELRKHGVVEELCEGWSIIKNKRSNDETGWIISNECLEINAAIE